VPSTQQNNKPYKFVARTCSDALETTEQEPGLMTQLTNLVADPSTKYLWVGRPAAQRLGLCSGQAGLGVITALQIVGNYAYGMVGVTGGIYNGLDIPFCFDLVNNVPVTVTGFTAANCPTSQPTSGHWIPVSTTTLSKNILIAHPGYPVGANEVGAIDISTPGTPIYSVQTIATQPLPCSPIAVASFGNRAWYLCNPVGLQPVLAFSDVLAPFVRTNAAQAVTFNDFAQLTAVGTLQFLNQLGGIVQALIVFKAEQNMFQITGDYAQNNLGMNAMNVATGTLASNSITNTPKGMIFMSPDGYRLMDQNGTISDPVGVDGAGVAMPFINVVEPSRVVAASNAKVVRVSLQNGNPVASQPWQEWWYDLTRSAWCGPHTFPAAIIAPWKGTFIMQPVANVMTPDGSLWRSDVYQTHNSQFMEPIAGSAGVAQQMTFSWQTSLVPEQGEDMSAYEAHETYMYLAFDNAGSALTMNCQTETGRALDSVSVSTAISASLWGTAVWGSGIWGGLPNPLTAVQIPWHYPLQFSRARFTMQGNCNLGLELGALYVRIEHLGYNKMPGTS
jgi:hypothetical protein